MFNEKLRLFTAPPSPTPQDEICLNDFDFKNLELATIDQILRLKSPQSEPVDSVKVDSLANGFNLEITGGGIYRINATRKNQETQPLILKAIPPFVEQQQAMFAVLDKLGQNSFIDLLAQYPSNRLSQRELSTYAFLAPEFPILTPGLLFGILNDQTEQAWIFMDDLSKLTTVSADVFTWNEGQMKAVVGQIADFHAQYWNQDSELKKHDWLGNWWTNRHNDFIAEDVTTYALETCRKLHPDLLTPSRYEFLARAIKQRAQLHSLFQEQPQTLIHWDMGPHNMKLNQSKQPNQLAVFDWELTSIGVAQWDLAQFMLPILGGKDHDQISRLIEDYLGALPLEISSKINKNEFFRIFDLVVLDHFFRVCGPIVFANGDLDDTNVFFREWKHCLEWIELRLMNSPKK